MRRTERFAWRAVVAAAVALLAGGRAPAAAAAGPAPQSALEAALADERHAAALYQAVLLRHGMVMPFVRILESELTHIDHLLELFAAYGIDPPPDLEDPYEMAVPYTLKEACRLGAANERETVALYDGLLEEVGQPDVRELFVRLREVSRVRHLPAFERCAGRAGRGDARP